MSKTFEEAAFSQKVNQIGPVIETKHGYHVVQVLEHNQEATQTLDEARERITAHLNKKARQKALSDYLEALKSKAEIKYADGIREPS
jgi:parvulin-like peptidyl-prolyl isomerase